MGPSELYKIVTLTTISTEYRVPYITKYVTKLGMHWIFILFQAFGQVPVLDMAAGYTVGKNAEYSAMQLGLFINR